MKRTPTIVFIASVLFLSVYAATARANSGHKCQAVLEENFRACNEEDIPALMATISRQAPGCDRFEQEATEAFAAIDVYMRLEGFQVIGQQGDMLAARVTQKTLAKPEDHENGMQQQINYRRYVSALLPQYETVVYTQTFKREGGKWRLWLIDGVPARVGDAPEIGETRFAIKTP